jgi:Tfp pilus assembly protein FimT
MNWLIRSRRFAQVQDQRGFSMAETVAAVALSVTAAAAVVPATLNTVHSFRVNGNAHGLVNHLAVAKMRAAANFTRTRLYVDLATNSYHVEAWQKTTNTWVTEGGTERLSANVTFGFGTLGAPPPNTQGTIGQASQCLDNQNNPISSTACVVFNSRGMPVDPANNWAPTAADAIYMTGRGGVFGVTISATSRVQLWWSGTGSAAWLRKQ